MGEVIELNTGIETINGVEVLNTDDRLCLTLKSILLAVEYLDEDTMQVSLSDIAIWCDRVELARFANQLADTLDPERKYTSENQEIPVVPYSEDLE